MKITALLVLKCMPEGADPIILANACDVSHFGFFQRSSVREFIVFVSRTVAKRTPPGQRQSVQHDEYKVHSYNRNGLCVIGFMDDHYPVRSAFSLLNQVIEFSVSRFVVSFNIIQSYWLQYWCFQLFASTGLGFGFLLFEPDSDNQMDWCRNSNSNVWQVIDEYQKNFGESWRTAQADSTEPWPYLDNALTKYQDPAEADKLLKIQRELDET
ncbi:hypothetical protein Goari_026885, partial [Gossypium aridum]|nr:hypothetical protein [Gossypium aridum]